MAKASRKKSSILTLTLFVLSVSLFVCCQVDAEKKYAPLVGVYEFDMQEQIMVVSFWVEDGKMVCAPLGEAPEEMNPVEGKSLKFKMGEAADKLMELEFVKDDSGKVTKCIVLEKGMEMVGVKVK